MRLSPHLTLALPAILLGFAACQGSESPSTGSQISSAAATAETTLEEDFSYPGAESYLASGITLKTGDGNLLIVDCATRPYTIKVESYQGNGEYCFEARGPKAFVTLELDGVFLIWTSNASVQASVLVGGEQSVVDLEEGYNPVGFGSGGELGARLLELRLSP
jgi:hypothetical protein